MLYLLQLRARPWVRLVDLIRKGAALFAILCLPVPAALADCAKDLHGEIYCGAGRCARDQAGTIWCSRFFEGGAQTTTDRRVLCGKGQCAKNIRGEIFCSSEVGGAVLKDSYGQVRCQGRCERATEAQCENTRADSAG